MPLSMLIAIALKSDPSYDVNTRHHVSNHFMGRYVRKGVGMMVIDSTMRIEDK